MSKIVHSHPKPSKGDIVFMWDDSHSGISVGYYCQETEDGHEVYSSRVNMERDDSIRWDNISKENPLR